MVSIARTDGVSRKLRAEIFSGAAARVVRRSTSVASAAIHACAAGGMRRRTPESVALG